MIKLFNIYMFLNFVLVLSCSTSPTSSKLEKNKSETISSTSPTSSKLEKNKSETISSIKIFKLINFTVVRVDPNGRKINVDRRGYNVKSGNAFRVPFEELTLESKDEKYIISTKNLGNGELNINGKIYRFNSSSQQLLIKFGEGIEIEKGGGAL